MQRRRGLLLAMLAVVAGCALQGPLEPLSEARVMLPDTPFFPQRDFMCGPAALATVLGAAGATVHPDELIAGLYIPERRGTLQVELLAAARRRGYLAVTVEPRPAAVVAQLQAGRPVLVLQNLAVEFRPVWHYAVVVGYRPEDGRFVLRSGRERAQELSARRFAATWSRGGNWGIVVLDPQTPPLGLAPRNYLEAAAALENTGSHRVALTAFRSAVAAWPGEPLAQLGVANNLYYLNRHEAAARAYRTLLDAHPDHAVAVHNLTMLLLELGRPCEARRLLADAAALDGPLLDTARRRVDAAAAGCPAA